MDQANRLYTAEQVRRLDRCAIEGHGIPGIDLMERAGAAVFEAIRQLFPDARRYLVLCGGGNNGGDGYIVARLAMEAGIPVDVCALRDPAELGGDAALAAARWQENGGVPLAWPLDSLQAYDVIVDALLGTGLDREPAGQYAEAIAAVNHANALIAAVDIPSGLNADTGVALGATVVADLTVTFIGIKRGLFTADGPDHSGDVLFDDLQTPDSIHDTKNDSGILIQENILDDFLVERPLNSHKGDYGSLAIVGSAVGMSGAVRLTGEAALRAGAGKVTIGTRPEHASLVNISCPELMARAVTGLTDAGLLLEAANVVVAGPGLGRTDWSRAMLQACIDTDKPLVLDADGLSLLADMEPQQGARDCVLTPHPGEAG
ncbi:MAG: NAD(P)H-hydrate epimerase, partial [Lysobacterales bacterium]